jgi:predicted lipid-binding transport protein (Tim44 family)
MIGPPENFKFAVLWRDDRPDMDQAFDPLNLLILAIAVVVFLRLRSVLGKRTGSERPPFDPYAGRPAEARTTGEEAAGNVLTLPQTKRPANKETAETPMAQPIWKGIAEEGSPLAKGLEKLAAGDSQFSVAAFLDGAKIAYEMVIGAFAQGDKAALKTLLSREVFDSFSRAIDQREKAGETLDQKFVGIGKAELVAADLRSRKASLTVRFVSELVSATHDKDGQVIDGDPKEIREITDMWTFERDVGSRDPNWKLAATEVPA